MAQYRQDPSGHANAESALMLAILLLLAGVGLGLLLAACVTPDLDPVLQAPARLKLMTMLTAVTEVEFSTLRDGLEVSDSVLSKHVAALASVGYVKSRKGVHAGAPDDLDRVDQARPARHSAAPRRRAARADRRRRLNVIYAGLR